MSDSPLSNYPPTWIQLSTISRARLATCHPDLVRLFNEVSKRVPTAIICGHRAQVEQDRAFDEKKSEKRWPHSTHNPWPSRATDAGPAKLDWSDRTAFLRFAEVVLEVARELGIPIRWGGDWDGDGKIGEPGEYDLVHFELA